jgi:hypothetical protein
LVIKKEWWLYYRYIIYIPMMKMLGEGISVGEEEEEEDEDEGCQR